MNSKITIQVDQENDNIPVIKIIHRKSEDVRDCLVSNFVQRLDHTSISRWLKIEYKGEYMPDGHVWQLVPIDSSIQALKEEIRLMQSMITALENEPDLPAELKA